MQAGQSSRTAEAAAAFRASHYLFAQPKVFEDPYAVLFTNIPWRVVLSNRIFHWLVIRWLLKRMTPVLAQVIGRSRYAEDVLAHAIETGIRQYVIVGAGLDSYALRCRDDPGSRRIFELDHPDTQRAKRARLSALEVALPSNLEFVAIDFERQEVATVLQSSGFRSDIRSFFSWLGTTHYLNPQTTLSTLRSIARCAAPGSEVVFDYSLPFELIGPDKLADFLWVAKFAKRMGEPIIGGLVPSELHANVTNLGYVVVEDLNAKEQTRRYFSNRNDGLEPPPGSQLLHLRLKAQ
jgi:methyltransferase (TIGR00027 family)